MSTSNMSYIIPIATLVASFGGAWFAYVLQKRRSDQANLLDKIEKGNAVLFDLIQMYSRVGSFKKQFIDPIEGDDSPFLNMKPAILFNIEHNFVEAHKVNFLLQSKNAQVLHRISSQNELHKQPLELINIRSIMCVH